MSTYSQIYIHVVFAVRGRRSLIQPVWEEHLYKYISGIVTNKHQKMIAINGMPDHIHFLIGMKPQCCLSDLVREIKKSTHEYIRKERFCLESFNWQDGFGAFSYSHSHLDHVIRYIMNQKEHHQKKTFRAEYTEFLHKFEVSFDDKYMFDWIE
jgi:REP element-mobilizing transposase RayT